MNSRKHKDINKLNRLAITHHRSGRLNQAGRIYRRILKLSPHHFDTLHMLGVLTCQLGETEKGLDLLFKALKINPCSTRCLLNIGKAFHDHGRMEKAISFYKNAISIDPDLPEAHNNCANALNDMGLYEEAFIHCLTALKLKPDFFEAYNNMGIALFRLGKLEEALASYQNALKLFPDFPEAYNNMGIALNEMRQYDEAVYCYKKAIQIRPDYPEAYNNLGLALNNAKSPEEAINQYKNAISLRPDYYEAMGNLAFVYERTNKIEKAIELANQALEGKDDLPIARLVTSKYHRRKNNFKAALDSINAINLNKLDASLQSIILYEKGAVLDRLGLYENAFQSFNEANLIRARHSPTKDMQGNQYIHLMSKLRQYMVNYSYSPDDIGNHESHDPDPIFIIGFPRSGTTLLDKIVGAHPKIKSLEEKPMVHETINRMIKLGFRYPEDLSKIDASTVQDLRQTYFTKMAEFTGIVDKKHLIDKFPLNTVHIPLIHKIFPKSKFIFALRHPGDVCLSCFMQDFKLNEAMTNFLDLKDAVNFYRDVMELWNMYVSHLPIEYHIIKYEALISDFDKKIRALFEFLDIEWDPAVLDYNSNVKSYKIISTPSYHQVSEPLYRRSIFRWKNYKGQLRPFLEILRPYTKQFGYDLV